MSIKNEEFGYYEPDEQEEKELEYVYAIINSWNEFDDDVVDSFPYRFWDRVCDKK